MTDDAEVLGAASGSMRAEDEVREADLPHGTS